MNELMKRIRQKARYLDADIHRELTIEEAQKELAVWSKDKIDDEDLFIRLSELKQIVTQVGKEFPLLNEDGTYKWDSETSKKGNIFFDVIEWYEKYLKEKEG